MAYAVIMTITNAGDHTARRLGAEVVVEDPRQVARRDADAGVAHRDGGLDVVGGDRHRDGARARRVLHGVADEVVEHLTQAERVGHDRCVGSRVEHERDVSGARRGGEGIDRGAQQRARVDAAVRLFERGVAASRAQHLGDEPFHALAGCFDQLEAVAAALGQVFFEQQVGVAVREQLAARGAAAGVILHRRARAGGVAHVHAVERDVRVVDAEQAPLAIDARDGRVEPVEHLVDAPLLRAHRLEGRLEPVGLAAQQAGEGPGAPGAVCRS